MSEYIEVDGLVVGPNMWRNLMGEKIRLQMLVESCSIRNASDFDKIDRLQTLADELKAALKRSQERVSELESIGSKLLQAHMKSNAGWPSFKDLEVALGERSGAWIMRQNADVIEQCMRDIHSLRSAFNLSEDEITGIKMAVQHCKREVKVLRLDADQADKEQKQ